MNAHDNRRHNVDSADNADKSAPLDVARTLATSALAVGSLLLTGFGFIQRDVGLATLASEPGYTVVGLMPGAAALSFIASSRAIAAIYNASVDQSDGSLLSRFVARFTDLGGAYGIFALVLSVLVSVTTGLAVALILPSFSQAVELASIVAGVMAFVVCFASMFLRASGVRRVFDLALLVVIVGIMLTDGIAGLLG